MRNTGLEFMFNFCEIFALYSKSLQVKACCDVAMSRGQCLLFWGQKQASEQQAPKERVALTTSHINRADDTGQTEEWL